MAPGMKWDAEADAKLFGLFLNLFDVKVSREQMMKLNAAMGLDPKSQAISHRIGAARKRASDIISSNASAPVKLAPLTPRGPKSGGTPRSRSTNTSKKTKRELSDDSDDSGFASPTANVRAKRSKSTRATAGAKRSYKEPDTDEGEEEDELVDKERAVTAEKVKVEQTEDVEGNGLGEPQAKSFFDGDGGLDEAEETQVEEV
ncbi:transcription factor bhlh48-like [Diplodia corticola]|uniref:Transcription factor bhlh48-like n=1 Tax=Diplodia corticola TaxID=236234 RepID=A0A1J9R8D1_9PEZI|nr:transcription factor bhlh48-like [Diplodia corticola]OJD36785.1 transcription factor bhlh48-like [Diplodia corticola]